MKKIVITTAQDPGDALYNRICQGFCRKYGDIRPEHRIDESLLGGFIAEIDGEVMDVSVRSWLSQIKKQMLG